MGQLAEWRNVQAPAQASSVLSVLLRTGDYETAKTWCAHVSFPQQKFLVISENYELSNLWILIFYTYFVAQIFIWMVSFL